MTKVGRAYEEKVHIIGYFLNRAKLSGCGKLKLDTEAETFKVYSELPEDITNAFIKKISKRTIRVYLKN